MTVADREAPVGGEPGREASSPGQVSVELADLLSRPAGVRESAAMALNDALKAVTPASGAREARGVLAVLEDKGLRELKDAHGRSVRALAVEALLRLGYPHALQIDPEDLAWFRSRGPGNAGPATRGRSWRPWILAAALLGVGSWGAVEFFGSGMRNLFPAAADALADPAAEVRALPTSVAGVEGGVPYRIDASGPVTIKSPSGTGGSYRMRFHGAPLTGKRVPFYVRRVNLETGQKSTVWDTSIDLLAQKAVPVGDGVERIFLIPEWATRTTPGNYVLEVSTGTLGGGQRFRTEPFLIRRP